MDEQFRTTKKQTQLDNEKRTPSSETNELKFIRTTEWNKKENENLNFAIMMIFFVSSSLVFFYHDLFSSSVS